MRATRLPQQQRSAVLCLHVWAVWTAEQKRPLELADSPACPHCNVPVQSLPHLLFKCMEFAAGRPEPRATLRGDQSLDQLLWPPGWARELDRANEALGCYLVA